MFTIDKLEVFLEDFNPMNALKSYIYGKDTETIFRRALIELLDSGKSLEEIRSILKDSDSNYTDSEIEEILKLV